MELFIN